MSGGDPFHRLSHQGCLRLARDGGLYATGRADRVHEQPISWANALGSRNRQVGIARHVHSPGMQGIRSFCKLTPTHVGTETLNHCLWAIRSRVDDRESAVPHRLQQALATHNQHRRPIGKQFSKHAGGCLRRGHHIARLGRNSHPRQHPGNLRWSSRRVVGDKSKVDAQATRLGQRLRRMWKSLSPRIHHAIEVQEKRVVGRNQWGRHGDPANSSKRSAASKSPSTSAVAARENHVAACFSSPVASMASA